MPAKKRRAVKKRAAKKPVKKRPVRRKIVKKVTLKKRVLKKKPAGKKAAVKKVREEGNVVGVITHYFPKVNVGVVKVKKPIASGDSIRIKGHTTDFTQAVASMQLEHNIITAAKKGQEIGLLVSSRVRQHDVVYKVY